MAEVGDVVRRGRDLGVVVARVQRRRAVRWQPLDTGEITVHEPEELEVVRRLNKRKRSAPAKILTPQEEPVGFAQWLGEHVTIAAEFGVDVSVPRAATSHRSTLARAFAALQEEGYSAEDFRLASIGVLSDDFMRSGGHVKPENVLRKTKIGGRIDRGRAWRSAQENGKYARFG